jgi:hypothetical protein
MRLLVSGISDEATTLLVVLSRIFTIGVDGASGVERNIGTATYRPAVRRPT